MDCRRWALDLFSGQRTPRIRMWTSVASGKTWERFEPHSHGGSSAARKTDASLTGSEVDDAGWSGSDVNTDWGGQFLCVLLASNFAGAATVRT